MSYDEKAHENANVEFYYAVTNFLEVLSEEVPAGQISERLLTELRKVYNAAGEVDNHLVKKKAYEMESGSVTQ